YHYARVIEMLHAAELIKSLLEDKIICGTNIRAISNKFQPESVGVVEAPRGTLFHHYKVDSSGKVQKVNLIIPTTQNNPAMNREIMEVAKANFRGHEITEEFMNKIEAAIRCYDPCLSCAAHALGQMPLVVQIISSEGEILDVVKRG
ncbi:MAG: nickel-dependent hydrogenase large subunit, partial [Candidatus Hadarchaeum sp.]